MIFSDLEQLGVEEKKASSKILNWGLGKKNFLNIITPSYNTSLIFIEIIMEFVDEGKSILYLTGEKQYNIQIIKYLKKYTQFTNYTYLKNSEITTNSVLNFCAYNDAVSVHKKYDLVIYDDIRSYPKYSRYEILDIVNKCCSETGKIIAYAIGRIFNRSEEIVMPIRDNKMPIAEPRIITTRVDINKDIPFVVYEYIKWSISIGKRVIITVPDDQKVFNVTSYIYKYFKAITHNIFFYSINDKNKKVLNEFNKYKDSIVVTDDFDAVCDNDDIKNIIVFFADESFYDYKKLVYFCGRTGKGDMVNRGEVIYLARQENKQIDLAKNVTRAFNKMAWEKGLLNL